MSLFIDLQVRNTRLKSISKYSFDFRNIGYIIIISLYLKGEQTCKPMSFNVFAHCHSSASPRSSSLDSESKSSDGWFTLSAGGEAGATPPSTLGTGGGAGAMPSSTFRAGEAIESSVEDGCWMGWAWYREDIVLRGQLIMSQLGILYAAI